MPNYECKAKIHAEMVVPIGSAGRDAKDAVESAADMLSDDIHEGSVKGDFTGVVKDFKSRYDDVSAWDITCKKIKM